MRQLVIVLGDQLDLDSPVLQGLDPQRDCVWMAEVAEESTHVWSHKMRILLFLSAMRNFRKTLRKRGHWMIYHQLGEHSHKTLADALAQDLRTHAPDKIVMLQAGDYRVQQSITAVAQQHGIALEIHSDPHFIVDSESFNDWADHSNTLRLESFYRHVRKQHNILMDGDQPVGGQWNFDKNNRNSFGKQGPGLPIMPYRQRENSTVVRAREEINERYATHPGETDEFHWPVTRTHAKQVLQEFIDNRLYSFGRYQDAMWSGHPFLFHSRLSSAMNLKLLSPREVIDAVLHAYDKQHAPIESVEGFIRQVIGWREYMRGIYWRYMPDYAEQNALDAHLPLPGFYWSGDTDMACLHETIGQIIRYGYAHHIQRLMVTGLFALLLGVEPRQVHEWYLAMFIDAVEWVELPNTLGMSQYADDGLLASKPYVASGKYIQRMSNYCQGCRYNPANASGDDACPFTTLYWDFLMRHRDKFAHHPRAALQWRNLERLDKATQQAIRKQADLLRQQLYASSNERCMP